MKTIRQYLAGFLPKPVTVTAESTPWGTAYKVTIGDNIYESSCDGTLWNTIPRGDYSFEASERCRAAVRKAKRNGTIEKVTSDRWDKLIGNMSPEFRSKIVAGGNEGRVNAAKTGLLP